MPQLAIKKVSEKSNTQFLTFNISMEFLISYFLGVSSPNVTMMQLMFNSSSWDGQEEPKTEQIAQILLFWASSGCTRAGEYISAKQDRRDRESDSISSDSELGARMVMKYKW